MSRSLPYESLQSAGKITGQVSRKILSKKGSFLSSLLYDWPMIVGNEYATFLKPEKISFPKQKNKEGVLYLAVSGGSEAVFSHYLQPLLLQKINQFFGYEAFHKIIIQQTKTNSTINLPPKKLSLSREEQNQVATLLEATPEGALKEALKNLGQSLYLREKES